MREKKLRDRAKKEEWNVLIKCFDWLFRVAVSPGCSVAMNGSVVDE